MGKSLLKSILENEGLKRSREIFAEYGLNPEKYPLLDSALKKYEERKKLKEKLPGEIYFRNCPVCEIFYLDGNELCEKCLEIYKQEELFWKQGKKLEN